MKFPILYGYVDAPLLIAKWGVAVSLTALALHLLALIWRDWRALYHRRAPFWDYVRRAIVRVEVVPASGLAAYFVGTLLFGDPIDADTLMHRSLAHFLWFALLVSMTLPRRGRRRQDVPRLNERRAPSGVGARERRRGGDRRKGR